MRFIVVIIFALFSLQLQASSASGEFEVTERCELFQSKRKKTNPGQLVSAVGQILPIIEITGNQQTLDWVRVMTDHEPSPERWVSGRCGVAKGLNVLNRSQTNRAACDLPNQYDSQVLALSWQSAFCELRGAGKPECQSQTSARFDANHFTLHGLWPNRKACGRNYGYCGSVHQKPENFCDYPSITLTETLAEQLGVVMPSSVAGTCLERHEWWKHGACAFETPEAYYRVALVLTDQINSAPWINQFIQPNIGKQVDQVQFRQAFINSFGKNAEQRLVVSCSGEMLSEIQIHLPIELTESSVLTDILNQPLGRSVSQGNCPKIITIDAAGR